MVSLWFIQAARAPERARLSQDNRKAEEISSDCFEVSTYRARHVGNLLEYTNLFTRSTASTHTESEFSWANIANW